MWKRRISEGKETGGYKRGQIIFYENNIVQGMHFIYDGKVKIFSIGKKNRKPIFRLASRGEILGLGGYPVINYVVSSMTLSDTIICRVPKELFFHALKANTDLAVYLVHYYSRQVADSEIQQKHRMFFNTAAKVAEALLMVRKKFGKETPNGILLDVAFSRQDLANLAGIAYEETIRILSTFKRQDIISLHKNKIMILESKRLWDMIIEQCCDEEGYPEKEVKCCNHLLDVSQ